MTLIIHHPTQKPRQTGKIRGGKISENGVKLHLEQEENSHLQVIDNLLHTPAFCLSRTK